MKGSPRASATRRPTADLPAPAGPSTAMMTGSVKLCGSAEGLDLRLPDAAPVTFLQAAQGKRPEGGPLEVADRVTDRLQHPAHLPVAALPDGQPDLGEAADRPDDLHLRRGRLAVLQLD